MLATDACAASTRTRSGICRAAPATASDQRAAEGQVESRVGAGHPQHLRAALPEPRGAAGASTVRATTVAPRRGGTHTGGWPTVCRVPERRRHRPDLRNNVGNASADVRDQRSTIWRRDARRRRTLEAEHEPRCSPRRPAWAVCEELRVVVTAARGAFSRHGKHVGHAGGDASEFPFSTHRTLVDALVSGAFERFPKLVRRDRAGRDVDPVDDQSARCRPPSTGWDRSRPTTSCACPANAPAPAGWAPASPTSRPTCATIASTGSCGGATTAGGPHHRGDLAAGTSD